MIVGLGNPGRAYQWTRHNFGFLVIDALLKKYRAKLDRKDYSACWGKVVLGRKTIILSKPFIYMNLSGQTVEQLVKKFRIKLKDLLIVVDDVNLPWAKLRFRRRGSAGGHNGLKSIIECLGSDEFARLRLGVSGSGQKQLINYVLSKFNRSQKKDLPFFLKFIVEAIEVFVTDGIEEAMNRFNKSNVFKTK